MTRKMTKMTAREHIGHFKARIHNEIHDPMSDDDNKGMATVTRSMCRELDNLVRAVEERCAKVVEEVGCPNMAHRERTAAAIRKGGR